jgi:hypothetical protein
MAFDLRKSLGLLFLLLGLLIAGYGLLFPDVHAEVIPSFNVNAVWGSIMALFGAILLVISHKN